MFSFYLYTCGFYYLKSSHMHFIYNYRKGLIWWYMYPLFSRFAVNPIDAVAVTASPTVRKPLLLLCTNEFSGWNCSLHTLQLLQHGPEAHSASVVSLQVIGSQQGSLSWHSSIVPQSQSSPSSTILFPHVRRITNCNSIQCWILSPVFHFYLNTVIWWQQISVWVK